MSTELPGLTEQGIELTVKDTMMSIRGTFPSKETSDNMVWHRHGCDFYSTTLCYKPSSEPNRIGLP